MTGKKTKFNIRNYIVGKSILRLNIKRKIGDEH